MLDSFPSIFTPPSRYRDHIAVQTSLSTTTRISVRIKALQGLVQQAMSLDQREALSHGLGVLVEAYEEGWEGWEGGSNESDDE